MAAVVDVRPLTAAEFDRWADGEVESYAHELVEASGMSIDAARQESAAQTAGLLPQGVETPGMHLLRVIDASGTPVGILWVGPHPRRPNAGWVYDVVIDEGRRGEGLGRAAMRAAEDVARAQGWTALGLNVFGGNTRARTLYESLRYSVDFASMTKVLDD